MIRATTSHLLVPSPLRLLSTEKRAEAWGWLLIYAEKVILEVDLLGWTLARVRLRDLFPIFERILGPKPPSVV